MPLQKDKDIWREDLTEEERKEAKQKLREYLDTIKNKCNNIFIGEKKK